MAKGFVLSRPAQEDLTEISSLIVYRRGQPQIEVIGVLHAARDVPRILGER